MNWAARISSLLKHSSLELHPASVAGLHVQVPGEPGSRLPKLQYAVMQSD